MISPHLTSPTGGGTEKIIKVPLEGDLGG